MEKRFIMTAFGKDRPGVVEDVSRLLFEHGCNLEDSSMTRLADEFAVILLFTNRKAGVEQGLERECRRLERERGISAYFREAQKEAPEPERRRNLTTIRVEGIDHTGIVFNVSRFLSANGINIENLSSEVVHSPESGTARYRMEIQVELPRGASADTLRNGLDRLAGELNVDITF
jgi:glycine cleavage system transcriptional repressor